MNGVDKDNPPQIPTFDRNKYKFPSSKVQYTDISILQHDNSDINISQYNKKSEGIYYKYYMNYIYELYMIYIYFCISSSKTSNCYNTHKEKVSI